MKPLPIPLPVLLPPYATRATVLIRNRLRQVPIAKAQASDAVNRGVLTALKDMERLVLVY